ncbi:MAG: hypothetical protein ABSH13_08010 [Candidatus Acidiferrum sp.]|jgi:hypothetical protein
MPLSVKVRTSVKVADEVWIAVASLEQDHATGQTDFSIAEIMDRVRRDNLYGSVRPGVYVHVIQHCVANRPPNPARHRMLLETAPGRRRLFRKGDAYHPDREGGRIAPSPEDLPPGYEELVAWYREWSETRRRNLGQEDPLLALRGSGKQLWADEHADEYVRRLREGWE